MRTFLVTALVLASRLAHAEDAPADDGYCDYVEGVAKAQAAVLFAPTVFGQFGLIEQAAGAKLVPGAAVARHHPEQHQRWRAAHDAVELRLDLRGIRRRERGNARPRLGHSLSPYATINVAYCYTICSIAQEGPG